MKTKKAPAPKTAPKAAPAKTEDRPVSKLQLDCLRLLAKKGEMTRPELSKALDDSFIGSSVMGHLEAKDVEPNSLRGRGFVTVNVYPAKDGGNGPAHYKLTAAGKAYLSKAK